MPNILNGVGLSHLVCCLISMEIHSASVDRYYADPSSAVENM